MTIFRSHPLGTQPDRLQAVRFKKPGFLKKPGFWRGS
jgi:hypothetical protein